jgi:hypothetical protein
VGYAQVGLVDADNHRVEEEVTESLHVLDNDHGGMDAIRMITECLARYNNLQDEVREERCSTPIGFEEEEEALSWEEGDCTAKVMEDLLEHARTPLFTGASTNRLVSILLLLNCFAAEVDTGC